MADTEFVRLVRDALAHLYDHAYLQRHPLARSVAALQPGTANSRGRELRRILLDAIEALNPGANVPVRALERRPYAILFGLYVEGQSQSEVAAALGIGPRQLRRDRADALVALASLVQDRLRVLPVQQVSSDSLRRESERLAGDREPVDVTELVRGILPLVSAMASQRNVAVAVELPEVLPQPLSNRTLLRQVLIGLASQALGAAAWRRLTLQARVATGSLGIGLALEPGISAAGQALESVAPAAMLAEALGADLLRETQGDVVHIWVLLPLLDETLILVVDDNQKLFALFQRYAAGQPYRLLHAASADQALQAARALKPDIVTIDLMLPERDGWELLQALRADPATAGIPALVCSVLEEPALALAMGAQGYLKKPVGQAELLAAWEAVRRQAWAGAGHPAGPAGS
ncbi:MAG: response regulator [Anaerolineae bacterium]